MDTTDSVIRVGGLGTRLRLEREAFPGLLAAGARVMGHVDVGYWRDIGRPSDFVAGSADLVLALALSDGPRTSRSRGAAAWRESRPRSRGLGRVDGGRRGQRGGRRGKGTARSSWKTPSLARTPWCAARCVE